MNITYHHDKQLAFSEAFIFVFEGMSEMLEKNLTHPVLEFGNRAEVIYAKDADNDQVVYALVFTMDNIGRVNSYYGYTHPDYRGNQIAVTAFNWLEKNILLKRPGLSAIYVTSVDDNGKIQKVFEKTGRSHYTTKYVKFFRPQHKL